MKKELKQKQISMFIIVQVGRGGKFIDAVRVYKSEEEALNHCNSLNAAYPKMKWIVASTISLEG